MTDTPAPSPSDNRASSGAHASENPIVRQAATLLADLVARSGERDQGATWKQLQTVLRKAPVDQMRVARIVAERNTDALAKIVGDLAAGRTGDTMPKAEPRGGPMGGARTGIAAAAAAGAEAGSEEASETGAAEMAGVLQNAPPMRPPPPRTVPTPQELKAALAAFRKRLKLTRLDQESRLGANRPTTGGKRFDEIAILPPNQYPRQVWDELAKQGKIRDTGGGFFTLVEKAGKAGPAEQKEDEGAEG